MSQLVDRKAVFESFESSNSDKSFLNIKFVYSWQEGILPSGQKCQEIFSTTEGRTSVRPCTVLDFIIFFGKDKITNTKLPLCCIIDNNW